MLHRLFAIPTALLLLGFPPGCSEAVRSQVTSCTESVASAVAQTAADTIIAVLADGKLSPTDAVAAAYVILKDMEPALVRCVSLVLDRIMLQRHNVLPASLPNAVPPGADGATLAWLMQRETLRRTVDPAALRLVVARAHDLAESDRSASR